MKTIVLVQVHIQEVNFIWEFLHRICRHLYLITRLFIPYFWMNLRRLHNVTVDRNVSFTIDFQRTSTTGGQNQQESKMVTKCHLTMNLCIWVIMVMDFKSIYMYNNITCIQV